MTSIALGLLLRLSVSCLGPEFEVDQPVFSASSRAYQWTPAVAFDGAHYLVVWADGRRTSAASTASGADVFATRVAPDGQNLDERGILVGRGDANGDRSPAVAFNGFLFLVVWSDFVGGVPAIRGVRIDPSGAVLDPDGFNVALSTNPMETDYRWPAVAAAGGMFLVVWNRDSSSSADASVAAARVDGTGAVLDPGGLILAPYSVGASVTGGGTDFLVSWGNRAAVVGLDGAIQPSVVLPPWNGPNSVAWNGTEYLAVWTDAPPASLPEILAVRISSIGTVLDPTPLTVVASGHGYPEAPFVSANGADFLVAWTSQSAQVLAARVSSAGQVLDPDGFLVATPVTSTTGWAKAAYGISDYLVLFSYDSNLRLSGARVSSAGTVLDASPFPVGSGANREGSPAAAFDGTQFLVAWVDSRSDDHGDVFVARLAPDGTLKDPQALGVTSDAVYQLYPAVAASTSGFLVTWLDPRNRPFPPSWDPYFARISPTGVVLDPGGIPLVGNTPGNPGNDVASTIASSGTNYAIAYMARSAKGLEVAVVDANAAFTKIPITSEMWAGAIASNGQDYLVAWYGAGGGRAARISANGTLLDPTGFQAFTTSYTCTCMERPALVSDGVDYLSVWCDLDHSIRVTRISASGAVANPTGTLLTTTASTATQPSKVVFDGTSYLVSWERLGGGTEWATVSRSGDLIGSPPLPVPAQALASDGAGSILAIYPKQDDTARVWTSHLFGRLIALAADGASCGAASDCRSGCCVAGTCQPAPCPLPDAGALSVDAGTPDEPDASVPAGVDASAVTPPDAASADAGAASPADASAGSRADAGGLARGRSGCGCGNGASTSPLALAALLLFAVRRRREG